MPAPIDEIVKRRVIQQWLAGEAREKIIADNDIAAGTVSIVVDEYKTGLDNFNLDAFRELTLDTKKRGMTTADLASFFRLYNFFRGSRAKEIEVESFITNINSSYITPDLSIELVNEIYNISKSETVPPDQLPDYVRQKLEENQKIEEQTKEADNVLQSKNVNIEAINEHLQLNEKLKEHGLPIHDIDKLLNVLENAKRYGFGGKEIVDKLWNIQNLEWKEKELKDKCNKLSKKMSKYKDVVRLAEEIAAWGVNMNELLALKTAIDQAAKHYNLPFIGATVRLIEDIKDYNKIGGLKKEVSNLSQQVFVVNQVWANQNKAMMAMLNLQNRGITEDRILELNNFLENNEYKDMNLNRMVR